MLKGATARRYAEAVFEIGVEQGTVDRWRADLSLIAEYLGDHSLAFILGEPNIAFDRKELIVKDLLASKLEGGLGKDMNVNRGMPCRNPMSARKRHVDTFRNAIEPSSCCSGTRSWKAQSATLGSRSTTLSKWRSRRRCSAAWRVSGSYADRPKSGRSRL